MDWKLLVFNLHPVRSQTSREDGTDGSLTVCDTQHKLDVRISELHFLFHMLHFYKEAAILDTSCVRSYIVYHAACVSHCQIKCQSRKSFTTERHHLRIHFGLYSSEEGNKIYAHKFDARKHSGWWRLEPVVWMLRCNIITGQTDITAVFHRKVGRLQVFLMTRSCTFEAKPKQSMNAASWREGRRKESTVKKHSFWTYLWFKHLFRRHGWKNSGIPNAEATRNHTRRF